MQLPQFPVDDVTLDLIWMSLHPEEYNPDAESTSLYACLEFISCAAGSDTSEVDYEEDEVVILKNPQYSSHDLITALIQEVKKLRKEVADYKH